MHPAVKVVSCEGPIQRHWIGRDALNFVHGRIPWEQSPITIKLEWRRDATSRPLLVQCYRIDLEVLCRDGFARYENDGAIRLRFQRTGDKIQIAINRKTPALVVGLNPLGHSTPK